MNPEEPKRRSETADMQHASDCSLHNSPAFEAGPCDCGAALSKHSTWEAEAKALRAENERLREEVARLESVLKMAAETDEEVRAQIVEAGSLRFRDYMRGGVRGQIVTEWDGLESHVIEAFADRIRAALKDTTP